MNGNSHFIFGLSVGTMLALNIDKLHAVLPNIECSSQSVMLLIEGGIVGSIFPDIDNPKSLMGKLSMPISRYIGKANKWLGKEHKEHRGIFHDAFVYVVGLILSYIFFPPLIGFFIGCLSHIYLDLFNPIGIPSLIRYRNLHLGSIASNSKEGERFSKVSALIVVIIGVLTRVNLLS